MANFTATATKVDTCHYTLDVSVSAEEVKKIYKKVRNELRNQVALKGFRKGKAPDALLNRRYGKDIEAEVSQQLFRDSIQGAIEENELQPVTMPEMVEGKKGDLAEGNAFEFSVEFDVKPEFELPEYTGMELSAEAVAIADEQVNKMINDVLEQRAPYGVVERASQAGDMLKVSYSTPLADDEEAPEAAKRLLVNEESWMLLSEPEMLPGITEGLAGLSAGDEKELDVVFDEDYYEPFLAGKTVKYSFKVAEVHGKGEPELTDEIAKEMGADDAEAFRTMVRGRLEAEADQGRRSTLNEQVIQQLMAKVDFQLPPTQLENEINMTLNELKRQAESSQEEEKPSEDELKEKAEKQATERLRMQYLAPAIAEKESIKVTPEEIKAQMDLFKMYSRLSDEEFNLRYDQMRMAETFYLNILQDKVINKLVDEANVTDIKASDS